MSPDCPALALRQAGMGLFMPDPAVVPLASVKAAVGRGAMVPPARRAG